MVCAQPIGEGGICVDEFTPFGYDTDYGLGMARAPEATGQVDYFNSDAGSFSSYWMEIPPAGGRSRIGVSPYQRGAETRDFTSSHRFRPHFVQCR
ncbi:hypothetical protein Q9314_24950 (plasmid) [Shinella sumterensis]|nr:hypothetical protein Q9314_24950 [Shinella sumterensis]